MALALHAFGGTTHTPIFGIFFNEPRMSYLIRLIVSRPIPPNLGLPTENPREPLKMTQTALSTNKFDCI